MTAAPSGRASPLLSVHAGLGAKLTEFAGWQMPLQYEGVISEHNAVRDDVGIFDVSHLGKLRIRGADGGNALQVALTNDVLGLAPGRAAYSLVLTEDGGCIDDVFVYRIAEDEWMVVPNASNVAAVAGAISEAGGDPVDEWDRWAIIAIQGPRAYEVFESAWPGAAAGEMKLHRWQYVDVEGERGLVARTGYTGEKGVELYAPAAAAPAAWSRLVELGARPAGLGARDTLRLEMGYALYGHEISVDVNPLEAGLGWVLAWDTPFRGRAALEAVRANGPRRRLFGIRCTDKGVPRQGYAVHSGSGPAGVVTSGNYSPTLATGIALALAEVGAVPGDGEEVAIDARGRRIAGVIVTPPFVERGRKA